MLICKSQDFLKTCDDAFFASCAAELLLDLDLDAKLSKEGIIQGDPTSRYTYAIGLLFLAEKQEAEHKHITKPMFADNLTLSGCAD